MRSRAGYFFLFIALLALGCASTNRSSSILDDRLSSAKSLLDSGQYIAGQDCLEYGLLYCSAGSPELENIQTLIKKYPKYGPEVIAAIQKDIPKIVTFESASKTSKRINAAAKSGAISSSEIIKLKKALDDQLVYQVTSGTLKLNFAQLSDNLSVSQTPAVRARIFENSLEILKGPVENRPANLGIRLCRSLENATQNSNEIKQLKTAFPELNLKRQELECLSPLYPSEAAKKRAKSTVSVNIVFDPPDRLTQVDIISELKNCEHILIVDQTGTGVVEVTFSKLQYEVRQEPERSQTIMYQQHQVNLLSAALLMPKNATYQYEYVTGGTEIVYAFEIKAKQDNRILLEKLLRENLKETYSYCQNPRIQNVFGGVQPASFVANKDMARRCEQNRSAVSPEDLQRRVIYKLVKEVKDIDVIKNFSTRW